MKKAIFIFLILFLALFSSAVISFLDGQWAKAAEYHVSISGNDSNPGTLSNPWRTIQHAANSVAPGDAVIIHGGTYEEEVVFKYSGTADAPITFSAAPDETVTVESLEFAAGASRMNIRDLEIEGESIWRVWLRGNNHHITLRGLTITGGEAGVRITWGDSGQPPVDGPVSDITLEDSLIQGQVYTAVDCTPGPGHRMIFRNLEICGPVAEGDPSFGADGIAVERGDYILIENCTIHDILGDGIDLNSRDTAGNVSGIEVKRNKIVRAHRSGIKLWSGGRIENNVVWGSGIAPVIIGIYPGSYEVINNSVAFNMWDPGYSGRDYSFVAAYPSDGISAEIDLLLTNNIFAFNTGPQVGSPTGIYLGEGVNLIREGNNIYWSRQDCEIVADFVEGDPEFSRSEIEDGTWAGASGQGGGSIASDPLFLNGWPAVDLHLNEDSPAIDTGTSESAPPVDRECMIRPAGEGYDIGAYEHGSIMDQECAGDSGGSQEPKKNKKGKRRR
ncbi:MAG: right-handed parallel beta-helix repeat-containing protein [Candidatus Aminicenantes bacterium]|nr:right-handed parallel beta-helix repeat-containing protein [Candidatus Aminicenantes bacterium]